MNPEPDYEMSRKETRREAIIVAVALVVLVGVVCGLLMGCAAIARPRQADPAQVAQIASVAQSIAAIGAQGVLVKNPQARPQLAAVAEAIEQAIRVPNAPEPQYLQQLVVSAVGQLGPYGQLAALAVQGGLAFYQSFYAANVSSALDKQPAFKAVLSGLARGIRDATVVPAASLQPVDLVLRPARP